MGCQCLIVTARWPPSRVILAFGCDTTPNLGARVADAMYWSSRKRRQSPLAGDLPPRGRARPGCASATTARDGSGRCPASYPRSGRGSPRMPGAACLPRAVDRSMRKAGASSPDTVPLSFSIDPTRLRVPRSSVRGSDLEKAKVDFAAGKESVSENMARIPKPGRRCLRVLRQDLPVVQDRSRLPLRGGG